MGRKPNKVNDANCSFDVSLVGFSEGYSFNERFDIRKVSILSHEDIANRFHFNKELIDSKDYQLDMLPVVGFHDGDGFTSHDDRVVPYGAVIPNSARWEDVDGKDYKVVDVAFWKDRYLKQLRDLDGTNQSMEIVKISGTYSKELGMFEVEDFSYDALCVLGESTNPAFPNAKVFSLSDIQDEFNIFKEEFKTLFKKEGVDDVENEINKDGEKMSENDITNVDDKEMDENNIENVKEEDMAKKKSGKCEDDKEDEKEKFELSHDDIRELLTKKLDTYDSNGYRNYDIWVSEVFDTYCIYTKWESASNKYFKVEYTKSDTDVIVGSPVEVFAKYLTQEEVELLNKKEEQFNTLTSNYSELSTEVETLRQFKANVEEVEAKEKAEMEQKAKDDLIEKFALKLSKKEIAEVIDDVANFSVDEINTKLSVVLANKLLSSTEDFASNKIVNIDNVDKTYSREERLVAELKSKKK